MRIHLDINTVKHSIRVANVSVRIAKIIGEKNLLTVYLSALLHDCGKMYIDPKILNKKGKLSYSEREIINEHVILGYRNIKKLGLKKVAINILYHHENFNCIGGYPNSVSGNEIPIVSRIIKVVDVFDALSMKRPYKPQLEVHEVLKIMESEKDTFDGYIYTVFKEYILNQQKISKKIIIERGSAI